MDPPHQQKREARTDPLQRAGIELPQRPATVEDPQKRVVIDVPQSRPPQTVLPRTAMDIQKEKEDKEAMRRWRQQGILAGAARFAELEQALQEIRVNALQVLKTPYYRNCKAARNIRRVGMRVMRELCKKMRSETVLIGKERRLGDRGGGGDVSAPKRRRIGTPSEPKVPATVATADAIVGSSPAGVNFVLMTPDVSTDGPELMPVKQQQNMLN
ncbi:hypothetical protein BDL97_01G077700 [Sphagnum fallax]|nr:hypothetical protein BDL97_01G077700 [Sphagnum fallax]KAH8973988.1 hypothetical protein BDL97_01G077700 [Sphagnum fallax]KAH8973989.1 hypothetical protein BDL97_01G077700 [Sphagnum fallax]KAH8973990.1 hypothetical protein BDL97_01G077700 [Sphagnum fallax]KAH8973991.1 hypothetical protein BDL97_01G077700 [Sphagnum fallax]